MYYSRMPFFLQALSKELFVSPRMLLYRPWNRRHRKQWTDQWTFRIQLNINPAMVREAYIHRRIQIQLEDRKMNGSLCFAHKFDLWYGILRRCISSSNSCSAKKVLFIDTPTIWMCKDNVHWRRVPPPFFLALQNMRLKKLFGVLEKVPHKIDIDLHESDAAWSWKFLEDTYISGRFIQ